MYCEFFIRHSAKANLAPFQASMIDFYAKRSILDVCQGPQSAPAMVTLTLTRIWSSKN